MTLVPLHLVVNWQVFTINFRKKIKIETTLNFQLSKIGLPKHKLGHKYKLKANQCSKIESQMSINSVRITLSQKCTGF